MSVSRPTNIVADRNRRVLNIAWNDGHESSYPFSGLRAVCPCAECKGGHDNMGEPPDRRLVRDAPADGINLEGVEPVGSYALRFYWSDRHSAGIYTWALLRAACPCQICLPD